MSQDDDNRLTIETFEKNGPAKVRMLMDRARYNPQVENLAIAWLLAKDAEAAAEKARADEEADEKRRKEADEQRSIAKSTLWAAWIAAIVAVVGVGVSLWPILHSSH